MARILDMMHICGQHGDAGTTDARRRGWWLLLLWIEAPVWAEEEGLVEEVRRRGGKFSCADHLVWP